MKRLVLLSLTPFLALPAFAGYPFGPYPQPEKARQLAQMGNAYQQAQYVPTQYYPAQMMGGGGSGPVIVPPTIVNTQGYEHNSSKKSCKESVVDLFLFSVRRTTGDCTP